MQRIRETALALRTAATGVQPEFGASVMATGIVSVALHEQGQAALSGALLVIAAILWGALVAFLLSWLPLGGWRSRRNAQAVSSLTAVAGTAVLGSRLALAGSYRAAWTSLVIATILLLVLAKLGSRAWARSRTGASFLIVVAPQSLVLLAIQLSRHQHISWLALAALTVFALAVGSYAIVTFRFDFAALRTGAGEQWIAGGALAISALACGELAEAGTAVHALGELHEELRAGSLVLWALAIAWLPVLIATELRWPRLTHDVRRWATVFPVGMYAAMSFTIARVSEDGWIRTFARTWTWVALAVWAVVAAGALRRLAPTAHNALAQKGSKR